MSETFCYVAFRSGEPGYSAACVDDPSLTKETAKFVSDSVKRGYSISRVTVEEARKGLTDYLGARQPVKTNQPSLSLEIIP